MKRAIVAFVAAFVSAVAFAQVNVPLQSANNLSDVNDPVQARANLGVAGSGGPASFTTLTTSGNAVIGGDADVTGNVNVKGNVSSTTNTNPAGITNSGVMLSASPNVADELWFDSTQTADNRTYEILGFQGGLQFRFKNDAGTSATTWLKASGGYGSGITGITSSSGTGTWAHTGNFSATGSIYANGTVAALGTGVGATWPGVATSGLYLSAIANNWPTAAFIDSSRTANNRAIGWQFISGTMSLVMWPDSGSGTGAVYPIQFSGGQGSGITGIASNSGSGSWAHTGALSVSGTTTLTGGIASYNGVSTVANGIGAIIAKADATAQTANIASSTLYAVPSSGAGMYRVSCYLTETTAATTSSTLPACAIGWTDNDSGVSVLNNTVTPTNTANAAGAYGPGVTVVNAKASTNITFSTTGYLSSGATAMAYAAHVKLEYLGN